MTNSKPVISSHPQGQSPTLRLGISLCPACTSLALPSVLHYFRPRASSPKPTYLSRTTPLRDNSFSKKQKKGDLARCPPELLLVGAPGWPVHPNNHLLVPPWQRTAPFIATTKKVLFPPLPSPALTITPVVMYSHTQDQAHLAMQTTYKRSKQGLPKDPS